MDKQTSTCRRLVCLVLLLVNLTAITGLPYSTQAKSLPTNGVIDWNELEALLDPVFAERMEKLHIPGAVVVIVKDGRILFTKGYGYASLERKTPVIPDRTIFRIGSITKVFTATAVVQLADRGKINLGDDVNKYLNKGFKVPNTYRQPITFANLLTHTAGFDEISLGRRAPSADKVLPLGEFLKTRLVRRLPPGEVISYSTYGMTLAGHLVEVISGQHLREYFKRNIFKPLGMNRTSLGTVPDLSPDLATGYEYADGKYQTMPFEFFHTYPASDINSTATDMARFMIAHLQGGRYGRARVLSTRAVREMHRQHFTNHPRLLGWAYGFFEAGDNDLRGIGHGGSMDGYSNSMDLLPEQNIGLYVACNTEAGGFGLSGAVKRTFLNRYFPIRTKPSATQSHAESRERLQRFGGKYRWDVYCHTCPADARGFFPEAFDVTVNDDGTLSFWEERWRQIEPLVFQFIPTSPSDNREILVAFREDASGQIAYMFSGTNANEKVQRETR